MEKTVDWKYFDVLNMNTELTSKPMGFVKDVVAKVFQQGVLILENNGFVPWVSAGTALGLYRDKKLIPHDTDVDVEIMIDWDFYDENKMEVLIDEFLSKGFVFVRAMKYYGRFQQLAFIKEEVIFDVYVYYDSLEKNNIINFNEFGIMPLPKKFLKKFVEIPTDDLGVVRFLTPTEDYLSYRYGEDWATPKNSKESWENDCGCLRLQKKRD